MAPSQCAELDDLLKTCINYKKVNKRMWKLKELLYRPKVGNSEPSCINDPASGDLITDKETIKEVSLRHCYDILTKNKIRECDKAELEVKKELHNEIMNKDNKDFLYHIIFVTKGLLPNITGCIYKQN